MKNSPVQPKGKRFARQPSTPAIETPTIVPDTDKDIDDMTAEELEAATAPTNTLEATPPTDAPADAATQPADSTAQPDADAPANPNIVKFKIDGHGDVSVNLEEVPKKVRDFLMHNAVRSYVKNRVSTAVSAANTHNKPFDAYDEAMKFDPLQKFLTKPEGERKTVDHTAIVEAATQALYKDEMGVRKGTGSAKAKEAKDPVIAHITRTVVAELFAKRHAADSNYKYPMAKAEVGQDGLAWLRKKAELAVEAGLSDAKLEEERIQKQYINTARVAIGLDPIDKKFEKLPDLF